MFKTTHNLKGRDSVKSWRSDLTRRLKNLEIDLLIVVDMFLTGFDSKVLNTLWLDKSKKLEKHNLIQTFSRVNRICNEHKDKGNIISFRSLKEKLDEAIEIYVGDRELDEVKSLVLEKDFEERYKEGEELIRQFKEDYPAETVDLRTSETMREFMGAFGEVLKIHRDLDTDTEYRGRELFSDSEVKKYQTKYLDYREKLKKPREEMDVEEELLDNRAYEILLSEDIDIHYILNLMQKGESKERIMNLVVQSPTLRSEREWIEKMVDYSEEKRRKGEVIGNLEELRREQIEGEKDRDLDSLIEEHSLKGEYREEVKEILEKGDEDWIYKGPWSRNIMTKYRYDEESSSRRKKLESYLKNLMKKWRKYRYY